MKSQSKNRKGASSPTPPPDPALVTSIAAKSDLKVRVSEIYASVQGEGLLTGIPSVFVRTSGCNLRCWFCDTPFASWYPEGKFQTVEEIVAQSFQLDPQHVVLTGGEPMIYKQLPELCTALRTQGRHLTIETAGTVFQEVECDLMSISPKLSSSTPSPKRMGPANDSPNDRRATSTWAANHERRRQRMDVVRRLTERHVYQLKFVVGTLDDVAELLDYLEKLQQWESSRILLMPRGTQVAELEETAQWLEPLCQKHGFRFCPRAHIAWFGNQRGT